MSNFFTSTPSSSNASETEVHVPAPAPASSIETQADKFYHQAMELLVNKKTAALPAEGMSLLQKAIELHSEKALKLMVHIILNVNNALTNYDCIYYLNLAAKKNRDAAYALAKTAIGIGPFAIKGDKAYQALAEDKESWRYFYYAAIKNHEKAFQLLLGAVYRNRLSLPPKKLTDICLDIFGHTEDYYIGYLVGGFLCHFKHQDWPGLEEKFVYDPERGFLTLYTVAYYGSKKEFEEASILVEDGLRKGLFKSDLAMAWKEEMLKLTSVSTPSPS